MKGINCVRKRNSSEEGSVKNLKERKQTRRQRTSLGNDVRESNIMKELSMHRYPPASL